MFSRTNVIAVDLASLSRKKRRFSLNNSFYYFGFSGYALIAAVSCCFFVVFLRIVYERGADVGDAQLYMSGMFNGANVLKTKVCRFGKRMVGFPRGNRRTDVYIYHQEKNKHIEMFWFSLCDAIVV